MQHQRRAELGRRIVHEGRGLNFYEKKVILLVWPGNPAAIDAVPVDSIRIYFFGTHLESGIFAANWIVGGWSAIVCCTETPIMDMTDRPLQVWR